MNTPGHRLKERRKALKLTQRELGKAVGVAHVTISQWERDDTAPSGKNLFALSAALKCSPTWILMGDEQFEPEEADTLPRQLEEREEELLDLFAALPESEKEPFLNALRLKIDDYNRLLEELLKSRMETRKKKS
ncbi:helix-turn-helix domain-containing protein [Rahnella sp. FC061912-K]|uniref:helix-turn-helix domain-containing protein n=1 Tax=Rahnella rivi TaxID=2816249 RepID=UPI001C27C423|nr:helix-turn-helix domain-containing protein [Rahnella rivi]MBU9832550.1 helix-turn-helix domain-containing protein [Rahnella rivi]